MLIFDLKNKRLLYPYILSSLEKYISCNFHLNCTNNSTYQLLWWMKIKKSSALYLLVMYFLEVIYTEEFQNVFNFILSIYHRYTKEKVEKYVFCVDW